MSSNSDFSIPDGVSVTPVAGRIGAQIDGLRLSPDIDDAGLAFINAALLRHKVIFFRDQSLDNAAQEGFAARLGKPVAHPTVPVAADSNYILELNSEHGGRANNWHTDVTFTPNYPKISVLRGITIPKAGGDTVWANAAAGYQDLPASLRDLADNLWAIHTNKYDYAALKPNVTREAAEKYAAIFAATVYETRHPVVHVHPESGERSLILGQFVQRFEGYSQTDSDHLLAILQGHVTRLENTVRWRWRAGDVAIWDNRATQHYALDDYGDQLRVVRRVTLEGDVPVSIRGERSTLLKPAAQLLAAE